MFSHLESDLDEIKKRLDALEERHAVRVVCDKAVCPKCGKSFYPCDETARFFICECGQPFNIRVVVESYIPDKFVSPPRESCQPKDAP